MGVRLAAARRGSTPERVQAAARQYLTTENLTLYHYRPTGTEGMTEEAALAFVRGVATDGPGGGDRRARFPRRPPLLPAAAADRPPRSRPPSTTASPSWSWSAPAPPSSLPASTSVAVAPARRAPTPGSPSSPATSMRRGTTSRSAEEINREIEFLGTQIGVSNPVRLLRLRAHLGEPELRRRPRPSGRRGAEPDASPRTELAKSRALQLAAIKRSQDSSFQRPFELLYGAHFGNHPYGLPANGFASSVESLDRGDLAAWWKTWVQGQRRRPRHRRRHRGGRGPEAGPTALRRACRRRRSRPGRSPPVRPPQNRLQTIEFRQRKQSAIAVAYPTVPRNHEDWPKLRLLQNVTSGLAGTFFAELRGKRSLAYTVFAQEASRREAGVFIGYLATGTDKETEAREALIAEFGRLGDDGITPTTWSGPRPTSPAPPASAARPTPPTWTSSPTPGCWGWASTPPTGSSTRSRGCPWRTSGAVAKRYLDGDNFTTAILSGREE